MSFDPVSIQSFIFRGWRFDAGTARLTLRYGFDSGIEFEEVVQFAGAEGRANGDLLAALKPCFDLVHLLAGVSYYKAAVPPRIRFEGPLPDERLTAFAQRVYRNGLGEFAYRNGLSLHRRITFPEGATQCAPAGAPLDQALVVPLGGGKDSLVSVELLRAAGKPFRVISVGQAPLIDHVAAAVGKPRIHIRRHLSSELFRINRLGAYNGHVPISAILASIMAAGALLYGYDTIVMSNERSASAGNVTLEDGFEVNHQYSKSMDFERDFQSLLNAAVLPGLRYVSLLRPLSEIDIAGRFSTLKRYHGVFSSCNGNFRIQQAADRPWCCDCPKCRFVFLALAPFLTPDELTAMFGVDLLADPAQQAGYRELLGLEGHKPFECVGEIDECRSLVQTLAANPAWSERVVVAALAEDSRVADAMPLQHWLSPHADHAVPADLLSCLHATV